MKPVKVNIINAFQTDALLENRAKRWKRTADEAGSWRGESNRAGADQLAAEPLQGAQAPFEDEEQAKNNPENDTAGSCFQGQPRPARR